MTRTVALNRRGETMKPDTEASAKAHQNNQVAVLSGRFNKFVDQYELDMRGDKSLGNGQPGIIGAIRQIQKRDKDQDLLIDAIHDAVFGDENNTESKPGIIRLQGKMKDAMERYNRVVWLLAGAVVSAGVSMFFARIIFNNGGTP